MLLQQSVTHSKLGHIHWIIKLNTTFIIFPHPIPPVDKVVSYCILFTLLTPQLTPYGKLPSNVNTVSLFIEYSYRNTTKKRHDIFVCFGKLRYDEYNTKRRKITNYSFSNLCIKRLIMHVCYAVCFKAI